MHTNPLLLGLIGRCMCRAEVTCENCAESERAHIAAPQARKLKDAAPAREGHAETRTQVREPGGLGEGRPDSFPADDAQMSNDWEKCVRPCWRYTVDNFALSQDLEAELIERGLVSPRDLEDVRTYPTDYAKKSRLVWTYLSAKGPDSLREFCLALKQSGYAHLSSHLQQAMEQPADEEESTERVEDSCDVVEVWIYILPTYEDLFRANKNRITSALKKFLCRQGETLELIPVVSVNSENVDDKNTKPRRKVFSIGIGKTTAVDLLFPEGREDVFKRKGERLLKLLKSLLHLQSGHRILGSYHGYSCIVKLILPGDAALQLFLTVLFTNDLKFLESVMGPVSLKIGNLPTFPNGTFFSSRSVPGTPVRVPEDRASQCDICGVFFTTNQPNRWFAKDYSYTCEKCAESIRARESSETWAKEEVARAQDDAFKAKEDAVEALRAAEAKAQEVSNRWGGAKCNSCGKYFRVSQGERWFGRRYFYTCDKCERSANPRAVELECNDTVSIKVTSNSEELVKEVVEKFAASFAQRQSQQLRQLPPN